MSRDYESDPTTITISMEVSIYVPVDDLEGKLADFVANNELQESLMEDFTDAVVIDIGVGDLEAKITHS